MNSEILTLKEKLANLNDQPTPPIFEQDNTLEVEEYTSNQEGQSGQKQRHHLDDESELVHFSVLPESYVSGDIILENGSAQRRTSNLTQGTG